MDERQQDELGGVIIVSTWSRHRRIRLVSRMGREAAKTHENFKVGQFCT